MLLQRSGRSVWYAYLTHSANPFISLPKEIACPSQGMRYGTIGGSPVVLDKWAHRRHSTARRMSGATIASREEYEASIASTILTEANTDFSPRPDSNQLNDVVIFDYAGTLCYT